MKIKSTSKSPEPEILNNDGASEKETIFTGSVTVTEHTSLENIMKDSAPLPKRIRKKYSHYDIRKILEHDFNVQILRNAPEREF